MEKIRKQELEEIDEDTLELYYVNTFIYIWNDSSLYWDIYL